MADKTGDEQLAISNHIRETVFSSEVSGLSGDDENAEFISVGADLYGNIEIKTNKSGLDLINKWNTHKSGCSDCNGWS